MFYISVKRCELLIERELYKCLLLLLLSFLLLYYLQQNWTDGLSKSLHAWYLNTGHNQLHTCSRSFKSPQFLVTYMGWIGRVCNTWTSRTLEVSIKEMLPCISRRTAPNRKWPDRNRLQSKSFYLKACYLLLCATKNQINVELNHSKEISGASSRRILITLRGFLDQYWRLAISISLPQWRFKSCKWCAWYWRYKLTSWLISWQSDQIISRLTA